eukprot:c17829_g1_i2 orf=287-2170(+)
MVLLLAPSSATARALESSTSAAAFSFAAAPSTNDAASPAVKRQLLDYLLTSNSLRFRFLHLNYPLRKRGSFSHKFCAVSEHQGITSNFNPQLFELARKTASPLISTRLDRAFPSKEALKDGLQAGENGPAVKASNFVLDSPKYRALLPKWKRSLGQFLKSSFSSSLDAPPQAPVPPFTGGLISLLGLVLILGVILDRWIWRSSRSGQSLNGRYAQWEASGPQLSSTGIAMFLRRELRKKESVEWVNMVLGKLWKVYRLGLESWLVGLLQPLIDNLQKPAYVERVEIKQFYLGDEPISVRSVQRRASRRTNDLQFLTKLLTEDLPRLFVRPKKITIDFLKGRTVEPVPKDFKGTTLEGNKNFSGELSVTLVDARNLFYVPYSKTDPYVHLILGDQVIRSKRNSQTSVFGPPGSPIWNQDFQLLVVDPKTQRLTVRVQDYFGLTAITIGVGEVDLSALQDTVPVNQLVKLTGSWGPLEKRFAGELMLRMTYTAYVEDEDEGEEGTPLSSTNGYLSEADENDAVAVPLLKEVVNKAVESAESESSLSNVFAAVFAELNNEAVEDTFVSQAGSYGDASPGKSGEKNGKDFGAQEGEAEGIDGRTALLWLGLVTGLVILVDFSINFSNFLNP